MLFFLILRFYFWSETLDPLKSTEVLSVGKDHTWFTSAAQRKSLVFLLYPSFLFSRITLPHSFAVLLRKCVLILLSSLIALAVGARRCSRSTVTLAKDGISSITDTIGPCAVRVYALLGVRWSWITMFAGREKSLDQSTHSLSFLYWNDF